MAPGGSSTAWTGPDAGGNGSLNQTATSGGDDIMTFPAPNATAWEIPPNPGRSLQPDIAACAVITFLIACVFVGFRFYTRRWVSQVRLGAADWCILPALLCAAGVAASALEQVVHGAGKHVWELDPTSLAAFQKAVWYGIFFYNLSLSLSRISILLLFRVIFTYDWIRRTIQVVLVIVTAIGIWLVATVCTACVPLESFWDWSLFFKGPVYCQPANLWWANAGLHIGSDLVIMALPMPVLYSLHLPQRQKFAIVGVFTLGFFVCIISAVRLGTLVQSTKDKSLDSPYTNTTVVYWTNIEVNAAICCACIMTLKPLIQRVFPRLLSPTSGTRDPPTLDWITPVNNDPDATRAETPMATTITQPHQHYQFLRGMTTLADRTGPEPQQPSNTSSKRRSNSQSTGSPPTRAYALLNLNTNTSAFPNLTEASTHSSPITPGRSAHSTSPYRHDHDALEKSRYYHNFTNGVSDGLDGPDYDLDRDLDLEAHRTNNTTTLATGTAPHGDHGHRHGHHHHGNGSHEHGHPAYAGSGSGYGSGSGCGYCSSCGGCGGGAEGLGSCSCSCASSAIGDPDHVDLEKGRPVMGRRQEGTEYEGTEEAEEEKRGRRREQGNGNRDDTNVPEGGRFLGTPLGGGAYPLRAPPRAHLPLAVHMPRFVGGEEWEKRSPKSGSGSDSKAESGKGPSLPTVSPTASPGGL